MPRIVIHFESLGEGVLVNTNPANHSKIGYTYGNIVSYVKGWLAGRACDRIELLDALQSDMEAVFDQSQKYLPILEVREDRHGQED
jgi:hypothetical protein